RTVGKLLELRGGPLDGSRDNAPYYGPPNEPESPVPVPQAPSEEEACAESAGSGTGSWGGSWLAPRSSSQWANESAESLAERLSIMAPARPSQFAQGDAG